MRVLLIDPPFYRLIGFYNRYFPLGLVSIGTTLHEAGHTVVVYDADANDRPSAMDYTRLPDYYPAYLETFRQADHPVWQEMQETIRRFEPDLIGISIWTTYAASALHVADLCKTVRPDCPVVMGGPHATVRAEEVLRIAPAVDYVVRGEGEAALLELVEAVGGGPSGIDRIKGLSYRTDGTVVHNSTREMMRDHDSLPMPDRTLLVNRDTYSSEDMGLIMTSRGCPFSCAFCATETRQVRYRSIEQVIEEIRHVKVVYGTTQFSFKDDSFTVNRKRVLEFCEALEREDLRIGWECNTRVDLVTDELLTAMRRAGCNSIKIGIESGSQDVLNRMSKRITLEQIRRAAALLRKSGIHWTGYFLIGTPGETVEDLAMTLDFVREIRPDFASVGVYEPFPGTAMFEEGLKRGLVKPDMAREEFLAVPPNDYYKVDARRQVDTIDQEQFQRMEREMKGRLHAYNRGFGRLLKKAQSRARLYRGEPALLLTDFRKYLSWNWTGRSDDAFDSHR